MAKTTGAREYLASHEEILELPNLIDIQTQSFEWFITEGITELFAEISPIDDFTGKAFALSFKDFHFEEPKYDEQTAKTKNTSFEKPLKATVELLNKETGEKKQQEVFLGDYPWMTDRGTFIINGVERVVVSQLVRSPGVFFTSDISSGIELFGAKVIPSRGAWLELDTATSGVISVKIDRKRKIPVTTLLKAFGYDSDAEIKKLFSDVDTGEVPYIQTTLDKDPATGMSEALMEVYRRIRPGDLATVENSKSLIESMFFDFKRYDFSKVGRYKVNKRLGLKIANVNENRMLRREDLVEILREIIRLNNGSGRPDDIDNLANRRLKMVGELIQGKFRIGLLRMERIVKDRMSVYDPETVTPGQLINVRPIVASVREFFASSQLSQFMDQVNPLAEIAHKRRLNALGPGGLSRERAGFEVRDVHRTHYGRMCPIETPEGPNIGLVLNLASYAKINEYGFIETPYRVVINEVPVAKAAGHIARTTIKDDKGNLICKPGDAITEAMTKKIAKLGKDTMPVKAKATSKIVNLDAADERLAVITEANTALDSKGYFRDSRVSVRRAGEAEEESSDSVEYMDVSSKQIVSVSAALIPFLEHDYARRALMGANMQKQAVALVNPQAPVVGTGIEGVVARDSGQVVVAEDDGVVESATANAVSVRYKGKKSQAYELTNFVRSNQGTSIHQRTVVSAGQKVKKDDVLIDGMSTDNGELALGQNVLVAFMHWGGYNFEDAIVISQNLVKGDRYTSIHIENYPIDVRDTKLGPEVVTRDIANVSEESLKDLDEGGVVRIGAEVTAGDILVGKITPKGEQELSSEEKLLRAIFGEKARDVKDTSLRMPNGERGKVVGVKIFSREQGDELPPGVIMQLQVSVAQMRKVSVGDKMAGRHGNKGVIARILPAEDMPYMEDGRPVDIILNPLGVGARMNIGQIFETHLGWAAQTLGYKVASPVFEGVSIDKIKSELKRAGLPEDGKAQLFDGRTGEPFQERTTVGYKYMLKLTHMVDDKIHARSTGPYAMVTQQPLGGKAQMGGQRFGEMEVWALEAYGAAHSLQEILTIKSDDVVGRSKAYESIIKNELIRGPRIPESFNVLVKELQSLGLGVELVRSSIGEVDAEELISSQLDAEVDELGSEHLMQGDEVGDMPLVNLTAGAEDEFEAMDDTAKVADVATDNDTAAEMEAL
ncbi:MAG TPA: DNA-directed RNA polymerase subunit beta [Candidatus Saccharimonadales bacterium]|nr:DNA-directed RNA polymerase subunit beta [Candidatus Saccharimonadales bacterium]